MIKLLLVLVSVLPFTSLALAGEYDDSNLYESTDIFKYVPNKPVYSNPHRFALQGGLTYTHFDYAEDFAPPHKSTENGSNPGITISGKFRTSDDLESVALQGIIDYASGSTHYDGALQGTKGEYLGPASATTSDTFTNLEGRVIFNLSTLQPGRTYLRGYSGLGARSWTRKLDLQEDYNWVYLPLGLIYETQINDKLTVAFDAALKLMVAGTIKFHFSDINPDASDRTASLGQKPGIKLQAPVAYKLNPAISLVGTPFYEFSQIGQSNTVDLGDGTGIREPSSRTYQYGGMLSFLADL
jgi:hypothetical protein